MPLLDRRWEYRTSIVVRFFVWKKRRGPNPSSTEFINRAIRVSFDDIFPRFSKETFFSLSMDSRSISFFTHCTAVCPDFLDPLHFAFASILSYLPQTKHRKETFVSILYWVEFGMVPNRQHDKVFM